jgi:hypothetical protein
MALVFTIFGYAAVIGLIVAVCFFLWLWVTDKGFRRSPKREINNSLDNINSLLEKHWL